MNPQPTPQGTPLSDTAELIASALSELVYRKSQPFGLGRGWMIIETLLAELSTAQARASAAETALAEATNTITIGGPEHPKDRINVSMQKEHWARLVSAESALATTQEQLRAAMERVKELEANGIHDELAELELHESARNLTRPQAARLEALRAAARPDAQSPSTPPAAAPQSEP